MKPIIGITVAPESITADYGVSHRYRAGVDYIDAVSAAGGMPIMLSPRIDDIEQILAGRRWNRLHRRSRPRSSTLRRRNRPSGNLWRRCRT